MRPEAISMSGMQRLGRPVVRLLRDESGGIVIMSVIATTLFIAFGGLAIDLGRLYNLHTQLQSYADHVALAGAAELDGEAGAIARARQAIFGPDDGAGPLIQDVQTFAIGDAEITVEEPVFLSALPDDPLPQYDMSDLAPYVTTEDGEARFVHVTVVPRTMNFLMLPIMSIFSSEALAAGTSATVSATAVGGFTREVCNFPPLMMCNPYETATNKSFTPIIGQQVLLKSKGSGVSWAPGDFGLLDTVEGAGEGECTGGLGGTNRIRCVMALINPNSACVSGRVNIRPGQSVSVHAGLNVRFDIWDPPLTNKRNDAGFRPAANVAKGAVPQSAGQCSYNKHTATDPATDPPLPRDSCFASGTCEGGRFGNAITDLELDQYWQAQHGAPLPPGLSGGTRYDAYRHEIEQPQMPGTGAPVCAPSWYDDPVRDRRTLIVAVINCIEHDIKGATDDVPVIAFAEMFMTEPVGDPNDPSVDDLYVEMLGVADPGGEDGVLHDFPQLYR